MALARWSGWLLAVCPLAAGQPWPSGTAPGGVVPMDGVDVSAFTFCKVDTPSDCSSTYSFPFGIEERGAGNIFFEVCRATHIVQDTPGGEQHESCDPSYEVFTCEQMGSGSQVDVDTLHREVWHDIHNPPYMGVWDCFSECGPFIIDYSGGDFVQLAKGNFYLNVSSSVIQAHLSSHGNALSAELKCADPWYNSNESVCQSPSAWASSVGSCNFYYPGSWNYQYCLTDKDDDLNLFAWQSCTGCNLCFTTTTTTTTTTTHTSTRTTSTSTTTTATTSTSTTSTTSTTTGICYQVIDSNDCPCVEEGQGNGGDLCERLPECTVEVMSFPVGGLCEADMPIGGTANPWTVTDQQGQPVTDFQVGNCQDYDVFRKVTCGAPAAGGARVASVTSTTLNVPRAGGAASTTATEAAGSPVGAGSTVAPRSARTAASAALDDSAETASILGVVMTVAAVAVAASSFGVFAYAMRSTLARWRSRGGGGGKGTEGGWRGKKARAAREVVGVVLEEPPMVPRSKPPRLLATNAV